MDAVKQIFWADLQDDLYTKNSAYYLADPRGEGIVSQDGKSYHRPILSHPDIGTYTAHNAITFNQKTASQQTLTVDDFKYAAEDIDDTESMQTPYDLPAHTSESIRRGLLNHVEQKFTSEFVNARHTISTNPVEITTTNVLEAFRESSGKLSTFDAPMGTFMRAAVMGPQTVALLREAKANRESGLGDTTLQNGVAGDWMGYTVVENNNLPWSATLTIGTNPADGDTVTISGVTFEFQDDLADVADGNVGVLRDGSTVATSRANLAHCINGTGTAGTNYVQMSNENNFIIRRKRNITAASAEGMLFTGFGDIAVSASMTTAANKWSLQRQSSIFMVRGSIDLVVQFMNLERTRKESGFADRIKGLIGVGAKTFDDGAVLMVRMIQDASNFY
jgi:hypothetical protein